MGLVTVERRGGAAILTYANPPLGTMTAAGGAEMHQAAKAAAADPTVRCLILTGGLPDIFVRHYDVGELTQYGDALNNRPAEPPPPTPPPEFGFLGLTDLLPTIDQPVIAAINGLCMGGGFELALACDLRIAGRGVTAIGLPETTVGIFLGGGGTQRLPRLIGEANALEMILRGRVVAAEEAHQRGLVHELADDPLARALEIAAEFEGRGAEGIAYAKRLIRAALERPLSEGLAAERQAFAEVVRTPSAMAAMRRSLAGRPLGPSETP